MRMVLIISLMMLSGVVSAQKDPLERTWYNEEQTAKIQVYKATDGKFYGRIVWLKDPLDKDNKPKVDEENPNKGLQSQPIINLVILKNFSKSKDDANEYGGGTVYDPNNGKTYCGKLSLKGKELKLRGFICSLGSWFGRSSTWKLAE